MKRDTLYIVILFGGIFVARILRKPVTKAVWGLFTGPKFYADVTATINSKDPVRIQHLHDSYNDWPEDVQGQFNDSIRKLGLKRPW